MKRPIINTKVAEQGGQIMPKEKLYQCNFGVPKEIHKLFKMLAAKRGITMRNMYREACEQYLDREIVKTAKAELR